MIISKLTTAMLRDMIFGVAVVDGTVEELIAEWGYTPRRLTCSLKYLEQTPEDELRSLFKVSDKYHLYLHGDFIGRALVRPCPRRNQVIILEEGIQVCSECLTPWPTMFMVHDQLWKAHVPQVDALLCLDCFEKHLGRRVTRSDLTNAPINQEPKVLALIK